MVRRLDRHSGRGRCYSPLGTLPVFVLGPINLVAFAWTEWNDPFVGPAIAQGIGPAYGFHTASAMSTSDEIVIAENRIGYSFTDDLRDLLRECNGIQFWTKGNFPCRLLPASEIKAVHLLLEREGPPGLVALIEAQGDFVAMGLDRESRCYSRLVDCSHETFPHELFGVCDSLREMLALILDSKDEEWIWPAASASGVDFAE